MTFDYSHHDRVRFADLDAMRHLDNTWVRPSPLPEGLLERLRAAGAERKEDTVDAGA